MFVKRVTNFFFYLCRVILLIRVKFGKGTPGAKNFFFKTKWIFQLNILTPGEVAA